jgi:hypothetical protein
MQMTWRLTRFDNFSASSDSSAKLAVECPHPVGFLLQKKFEIFNDFS